MGLYLSFFSMHLKRCMAYKRSFFLSVLGQFLTAFSEFLGLWFLLGHFETIRGYTLEQCLLCAGVMLSAFSLAECFFRGFDVFPDLVRTAQVDRLLLRPRALILQVLCEKIELRRLGKLVQGVFMLGVGILRGGIVWTAWKAVVLAGMLLGGTAVFCALFLFYAALGFFTLEGLEFVNIFTDGARTYGVYPLDVFGKSILRFCTYVIPYALFQYYPLMALLERAPRAWGLLPLAAPVFLIPCLLLFRLGLQKYQSAGS